jgi:nitrite reductase/ring-hydroxylating ferredoxin subunit
MTFGEVDGATLGLHLLVMSDAPPDLTRRRLCQAMCAVPGLAVLQTVVGCGHPATTEANCSASAIGVGDTASLPAGQARFVENIKVFICHDSGGYYAMDAACPHVGTDVEFQSAQQGFRCPLHGSTFTFGGMVTMGPAVSGLKHYELCTTESGLLIVDTNKEVTADTRLVV